MTLGEQFGDLYHGTWAGWMRKGQLIRPSSDTDSELAGVTNFKISSPEHVYVTSNPDDAQWYAEQGYKELESKGFKVGDIPVLGARPTVYRVEPRGSVEKDPSKDEQDRSSYRIRGSAKIIGRHWEG